MQTASTAADEDGRVTLSALFYETDVIIIF
jgi:hypothetical protein